jgi:C-terminal processing protease CtpA/Prc
VSRSQRYHESSGRAIEHVGVLPDIVTASEDALTTSLEHAHETIRATARSRNRRSGHDAAPTVAEWLGTPSPRHAEGRTLLGEWLRR